MKPRPLISAVVAALVLFIVAVSFAWFRHINQQIANYRRIETLIAQLATQPPDDVTAAQWSNCVYWTWQLHSNFGGHHYFGYEESCQFADEFQRRLDGDVSLQTVDWIWDQYVEHTKGGWRYSEQYRPTTSDRLNDAERWGATLTLEEWVSMYRTLSARP